MSQLVPTVALPAIDCGCDNEEKGKFTIYGDTSACKVEGDVLHVPRNPDQQQWPRTMSFVSLADKPWITVCCKNCLRHTFHVFVGWWWVTLSPVNWHGRYKFSWPGDMPVAERSMDNLCSIYYSHWRKHFGLHFAYHPFSKARLSPRELTVTDFFCAFCTGKKHDSFNFFELIHHDASVFGPQGHTKTLCAWADLAHFANEAALAILKHKDACNSPDLQKAREALVLKLRSQGFYPDVQSIDSVIAEPENTTGT